jgi:4-hydroxyphenylpyruvate dioxygenase
MDIKGFHHLEFLVADAALTARFFANELGFAVLAENANQSTPNSLVMNQGDIHLIFSSPPSPQGPESDHLYRHGSGVKDIAFSVPDAVAAFETSMECGARLVTPPHRFSAGGRTLVQATVGTPHPGLVHSLIESAGGNDAFWPGRYRAHPGWKSGPKLGLNAIDHVAICTDWQQLDEVCEFYQRVFGLELSHQEDVATELSGMRSKVVQSSNGAVRLVFLEPAQGLRESQIAEYLRHHGGPGVQHVAFHTRNIVAAGEELRERDIAFIDIPRAYYEQLSQRVGETPYPLQRLRDLNILVDRDRDGLLLQAFTRHIYGRPTFFCEIIERHGATGFGSGNIVALFKALELDQERRVGSTDFH